MSHPSKFLPLILAVFSSLILSLPTRAQILPDGWPYRRPINVRMLASDAPGDNAACLEFYTNGTHRPDGADIRVTTADRMQVPVKIMQVAGDHDFVRLAFATKDNGPFFVWWGNPKPDKPGPTLEIKRGILTEVFRFPGGNVEDEPRMRRVMEKAQTPEGSLFVPEIFLAYNPLGEEWSTMFRYQAQFKLDKPVNYDIAFSVCKAGYLVIDGRTLLAEHQPWLPNQARTHKDIELAAGWHTIEVTQINPGGGETGVVVAWRKVGDAKYVPIAPQFFAPVAKATDGPLETLKQTYTPDFSIDPTAEAFVPPDQWIQRYTFEVRATGTLRTPDYLWDFGDGQTANLARVHHFFLTPGVYPVTLTVKIGDQHFVSTRRLAVRDRMYARFPQPPEDNFRTVQSVLEKYDPAKLSGERSLRGLQFFRFHNAIDEVLRWGLAWLQAKDAQSEGVVWQETFDLARLLEFRKEYPQAAEAYRLASAKPIAWETRVNMMRQQVIILCDYLNDGDQALKLATEWKTNPAITSRDNQQTIFAALAYAAVAKGDGKAAVKFAADSGPRKDQTHNQAEIDQGVLARNIETYIRTREFDTATRLINQWDYEYPQAIIEGFSRLLRVKLLAAEERPLIAAQVAVQHAKALPDSFYAAELLSRAADNYKAANHPDEAAATLDLLKRKYPESPYARDQGKKD